MARLPVITLLCAIVTCFASSSASADEAPRLLELHGRTMGTTYMVKIFDPPQFNADVRLAIDSELRRVNDQMSTYLKNSEISRFNASSSTDWFDVSPETALVVDFAQEVSSKTGGAFDVTVGPLVNAWSFGPQERTQSVPSEGQIRELLESIGYEKLSARLDPPALRKAHPELHVDLSAIAKGHGVDRVVALLGRMNAANVFVEIGGEVRTTGDKGGKPWMVGVQRPDAAPGTVQLGHPLHDQSMATSGDYRNYFEADGVRYSHTIDSRTGRPINHDVASVTVVAESCMKADAWATALNVIGKEFAPSLAESQRLDVLLIYRTDDGYETKGIGAFAEHETPQRAGLVAAGAQTENLHSNLFPLVILTAIAFGFILTAMAVGVMFGRRSISGSCGGLSNSRNQDGSVSCSLCSKPDACKDLKAEMQGDANR